MALNENHRLAYFDTSDGNRFPTTPRARIQNLTDVLLTDAAVADTVVVGVRSTDPRLPDQVAEASLPIRSALFFGAALDGVTDDTAALQDGLDSGHIVVIHGTALITAALTQTTTGGGFIGVNQWGFSTAKSRILSNNTSAPILVWEGVRAPVLRDIALEYSSQATSASAIALSIRGLVSQADVSNVFIRQAGVGVGIDQTDDQAGIFASVFSNVRVNNFGVSAFDFRTVNGGGTGCVLEALYANNGAVGYDLTKTSTQAPVRFKAQVGWVIDGLHVEGVSTGRAIEIDDCRGLNFGSIHFEFVTGTVNLGALVYVVGGSHNIINIDQVDVYNSWFLGADGVTTFYIVGHFSPSASKLRVGQLKTSATVDVTGCTLTPIAGFGSGEIINEQVEMEVGGTVPNQTLVDRPVIRRFGGIDYWRKGGRHTSSTLQADEVWRLRSEGAPTTGTWTAGSKVWIIDPILGSEVGYICVVAGTPGTWARFGAQVKAPISAASAASTTPNPRFTDLYEYTALAAAHTINAQSETPALAGQKLRFRFYDDGTARTLTWNAVYVPIGVTLPTTTVVGKWTYVEFEWNLAHSEWHCIQVNQEA